MYLDASPQKTTGSSSLPSITIIPTSTPEFQVASDVGERTLWVVFVVMVIAILTFVAMAWNVPVGKRLYHFVTTLIVTIAAISYFAMANGDGIHSHHIVVKEGHKHVPDTKKDIYRDVYWARYVDWALASPLVLFNLSILAGLNGSDILTTIVANVIMILTGLFAAFGEEEQPTKWGWYAIACIAYLVVVWQLAVQGRAAASAKGGKVGGFYVAIAGYTLIIWVAYLIIWGFADGSRQISVDGEIIAYAVLDILAKPVFGLWLLLTHSNMPEINVDLTGFWTHGFNSEGTIRVGDEDDGA